MKTDYPAITLHDVVLFNVTRNIKVEWKAEM